MSAAPHVRTQVQQDLRTCLSELVGGGRSIDVLTASTEKNFCVGYCNSKQLECARMVEPLSQQPQNGGLNINNWTIVPVPTDSVRSGRS